MVRGKAIDPTLAKAFMKPFCARCKDYHLPEDCPKRDLHGSPGTPRAFTHDFIAPEHVRRPQPRRSMFASQPPQPQSQSASPASGAGSAADAPRPTASQSSGVGPASALAANATDKPLPSFSPVTELGNSVTRNSVTSPPKNSVTDPPKKRPGRRGPKPSGHALTPAQKQAAYRARLRPKT